MSKTPIETPMRRSERKYKSSIPIDTPVDNIAQTNILKNNEEICKHDKLEELRKDSGSKPHNPSQYQKDVVYIGDANNDNDSEHGNFVIQGKGKKPSSCIWI